MKSILVKVTGMHCNGCEMNVKDMVSELDGVKSVKPSFKKEVVEVAFDEAKTTVDQIKAAIVAAGYKPE